MIINKTLSHCLPTIPQDEILEPLYHQPFLFVKNFVFAKITFANFLLTVLPSINFREKSPKSQKSRKFLFSKLFALKVFLSSNFRTTFLFLTPTPSLVLSFKGIGIIRVRVGNLVINIKDEPYLLILRREVFSFQYIPIYIILF